MWVYMESNHIQRFKRPMLIPKALDPKKCGKGVEPFCVNNTTEHKRYISVLLLTLLFPYTYQTAQFNMYK